ncbi:MAG: T9SS type A sorting domain-containing protein, partial [Bacteroidales bacterium]|nr:T9SS type A sorting domain-containing protein [Bacteroidales bacterium]
GMATISLSGITTLPVALSIIDASGRYMARHTITSTLANVSLPSTKGVYLLRLETTDGGTATTKIVVR